MSALSHHFETPAGQGTVGLRVNVSVLAVMSLEMITWRDVCFVECYAHLILPCNAITWGSVLGIFHFTEHKRNAPINACGNPPVNEKEHVNQYNQYTWNIYRSAERPWYICQHLYQMKMRKLLTNQLSH